MALNPMQRRARTSFIIGFLVALILGALVVMALLFKIKSINEAKEALEAKQKKVYVAADDLESGQEVTMEDFTMGVVQSSIGADYLISADDFEFMEDGEIVDRVDDYGNKLEKTMIMKIDVPNGTIITKDMMYESDDPVTDSQRIQEFNMISLPSQLKNGSYVDIRFRLATGQDFVVLAKKKVLGTTATTIWLKLDELEMALINNAIVESYMATGSKLYATEYIEAGMQKKATPTYVASGDVVKAIQKNPNILEDAKNEYAAAVTDGSEFRAGNIEPALDQTRDQREELVNSGNINEAQKINAARQAYIDQLDGSDDIGYTKSK